MKVLAAVWLGVGSWLWGMGAAQGQTLTGNLLTNPGAETGDLTGWTTGGTSNPGVDNGSFDPGIDPHTGVTTSTAAAGCRGRWLRRSLWWGTRG